MLQALWQANRPFILRVAIGLAVFLILMNLALSYRAGGRSASAKHRNDLIGLENDLRGMDGKHQRAQRNAAALEERVNSLRERLSLSETAEIRPPEGGDTLTIDFPRRKEQLWRAFKDRADRIHLRYPDLSDISFDERSDLTEQEWADNYALLDVLRRVLDAAVDAQLDRFIAIAPGAVETEAIPDDDELALLRYPIGLRLVGEYPEVMTFVRTFQGDRRYISIELGEVVPSDDGPGLVEVTARAVGIDLGPPREEETRRSGRGGFRRPR